MGALSTSAAEGVRATIPEVTGTPEMDGEAPAVVAAGT